MDHRRSQTVLSFSEPLFEAQAANTWKYISVGLVDQRMLFLLLKSVAPTRCCGSMSLVSSASCFA